MYSLDIETLIGVLQGLKVRGNVEARLLSGFADIPARSVVVLALNEGKMLSAAIYDPQGFMLFQGKEALEKIRQKVLTWQLTEAPLSPLSPSPPATNAGNIFSGRLPKPESHITGQQPVTSLQPTASVSPGALVPVRVQHVSSSQQHWSRIRLRVYSLVNGKNTVAYIAHLLALPVESVYMELKALQAEHMVDMR